MDTLLDFLAKGVLGEEHFNHLSEVVEEVRRQLVKPVRGHNFQTSRKGEARGWIVAGVDYHLVSKVVDVLPDHLLQSSSGMSTFIKIFYSWISLERETRGSLRME